jgi:hypothetical protein
MMSVMYVVVITHHVQIVLELQTAMPWKMNVVFVMEVVH